MRRIYRLLITCSDFRSLYNAYIAELSCDCVILKMDKVLTKTT